MSFRGLLAILTVIVAAFIGAVVGVMYTLRYLDNTKTYDSIESRQNITLASRGMDSAARASVAPNFERAARLVTPAVVHIKTTYGPGDFSLNPLELRFQQQAHSSGSGVIISDDGYIITNNHVIEDASNIEVVLSDNKRLYAKIVGRDPSTDLALLKIKARNLPFISYGNSDSIVPGEWVLAVGNPFELNSTVTAGIVSAKARNIHILQVNNNLQIESFIQTDAAVNPGNSGGALVNLRGELVGINSAIATANGSYQGYSFAIPVNLVKKIADDLLEFGEVQRGLLGIRIMDVDAGVAEEHHLDVMQGVFVSQVNNSGAAAESGIKPGDVIIAIDAQKVMSTSELQEQVARHRPGHAVNVTFRRGGKDISVRTVLKNFDGRESITRQEVKYNMEGATFENITYSALAKRDLDGGVLVKKIENGKWKQAGIHEDFIITYIDKVPVDNVDDLNKILAYKTGGFLVEGVYRNGKKGVYGVDWSGE